MAFIQSLKRTFGFSNDDDYNEELPEEDSTQYVNPFRKETSSGQPTVQPEEKMEDTDKHVTVSNEELPMSIFDGVIAIFNQSLPDFVKKCVDVDAQRRYIYDSLDGSLKNYLAKVADDARRNASAKWNEERDMIQAELSSLREQSKTMEASRSEWKQQQLSLDRQKRALSDRIHDLEKQVTALEAEKEQYELETKSLVNKIKVAGVHEADAAAMREEVEELRRQLVTAKAEGAEACAAEIAGLKDDLASKDSIITGLNEKIVALNEQCEAAANGMANIERLQHSLADASEALRNRENEIEGYNKQITAMNAENTKLSMILNQLKAESSSKDDGYKRQIEELKNKVMVSDGMLAELNASAVVAAETITKKDEAIAGLEQAKKSAVDSLEILNDKYKILNEEYQSTREELEQSQHELKVVAEIQEQLDRFEDIKNKKDARITALQEENAASRAEAEELKNRVGQLEEERAMLKRTIEDNLVRQASTESDLRGEIEKLKADIETRKKTALKLDDIPDAEPAAPVKKRRRPKISAIDSTIDNSDWLIATPPADTSVKPTPSTSADFGYQEPERKPLPDSDAQMSLW